MNEANIKHNTHAVQEAGAKTPASCISGTVIIPHKEGFMSKAVAFTLGFVTGAAALGAATYLAKEWTSEEDDEDEDEVTQPINDTGSRENDIDDSAKSHDVPPAQASGDPDATEGESSKASEGEAATDVSDGEPNAPA